MPKPVLNESLIFIIKDYLEVAIPKLFAKAKGDPLAYTKISEIFDQCVYAEKCDETKLNLDENTILDLRKLFHNPDEVSKYTKINHTEEHELFKKKMKKLVDKELEIAFRVQQQVAKALPPPQAAKVEDFNPQQKIDQAEIARKFLKELEDQKPKSEPSHSNNDLIRRLQKAEEIAREGIQKSYSIGNHIITNQDYTLPSGIQGVTIATGVGCSVFVGEDCQNIKVNLGMNSHATISSECKDITINLGMNSFAYIGDNCQNIHIRTAINSTWNFGKNVRNVYVNGRQVF